MEMPEGYERLKRISQKLVNLYGSTEPMNTGLVLLKKMAKELQFVEDLHRDDKTGKSKFSFDSLKRFQEWK